MDFLVLIRAAESPRFRDGGMLVLTDHVPPCRAGGVRIQRLTWRRNSQSMRNPMHGDGQVGVDQVDREAVP